MLQGDLHNFGKRVELRGEHLYKPRSVYWEFLFLDGRSPLRQLLIDNASLHHVVCPFLLAPSLFVQQSHPFEGLVERFPIQNLKPTKDLSPKETRAIGSLVALSLWFGLGDLHRENLAVGRLNSQLIAFPIDIECIFENFLDVSQSCLIPGRSDSHNHAGLTPLGAALRSLATGEKFLLLKSFLDYLDFLNEIQADIKFHISKMPRLKSQPIRVILRSSQDYVPENLKSYSSSEQVQLNRGDIPYFFEFLSSDEIYYFSKPDRYEATLPPNELLENSSRGKSERVFGPQRQAPVATLLSLRSLSKFIGLESNMKSLDHLLVYEGETKIELATKNGKVKIYNFHEPIATSGCVSNG